jgi:serine/threonine protein kinase/Tol biopolymer transport system component
VSHPIGARIGVYEILSPLGSGGMGEVYLARDTRLDRQVAIKFLPEAFARDPERLARFEREARVLASLNHPHIAQIYGLEDSGPSLALVMELVEGPTLAERIAGGPLPLDEALAVARQLAAALEAAHEQGIIHRDLKPANIKLRADGTVKVLDFGLAKLADAGSSNVSAVTSPNMTRAGVVLGTPAYMSPEQARGYAVDARADLWALGCVCYEMLTGRRAFDGETASDAISAVLMRDPDWTALPASTPAQLRRLLRRCLTRDITRRIRHAGDLRIELDELASGPMPEDVPSSRATPTGARPPVLPWAIAAAASVAAAWLGWRVWSTPGTTGTVAASPTRLEFSLPAGLELFPSTASTVLASPDGRSIVFVGTSGGTRQLFLRRLDQFDSTPLPGTVGTTTAGFCPDGQSLAFVTAGGELKMASLTDGLVSVLTKDVSVLYGLTCAADRIIFTRAGSLWGVARTGGDPVRLTSLAAGEQTHAWPSALPDGRSVIFTVESASGTRLEGLRLDKTERRVLLDQARMGKLGPQGRLFFYRDERMLSAAFDASTLTVTGAPAAVPDLLPDLSGTTPVADVSPSGVMLFSPYAPQRRLVWVSRGGAEQYVSETRRNYMNPRLSPDGTRLLVQAGGIWVHDLRRDVLERVTTLSTPANAFPIWLVDGKTVVHRSGVGLRLQSTDSNAPGRTLTGTSEFDYPSAVTADGKTLVFQRSSPETSFDVFVAPLADPGRSTAIVHTPAYEAGARLSRDGHWLVYVSNESSRNEIYVRPFGGSDRRWQVSSGGGTQPVWNPNGKEIFYRIGERMMAVSVTVDGDELRLSPPQQLFARAYAYGAGITIANYDVTQDGQRFVMVSDDTTVGRLRVILNWRAAN